MMLRNWLAGSLMVCMLAGMLPTALAEGLEPVTSEAVDEVIAELDGESLEEVVSGSVEAEVGLSDDAGDTGLEIVSKDESDETEDWEEGEEIEELPPIEVTVELGDIEETEQDDMIEAEPLDEMNIPETAKSNSFSKGQCTWWAYERWTQMYGYEPPIIAGNAGGWYDNCLKAGLTRGSEPIVGAIACWNNGFGNDTGHVAIVEAVYSDHIHISEYNWAVTGGYSEEDVYFSNINRSGGSKPNRYLKGYIVSGQRSASGARPTFSVNDTKL